MRITHFMTRFNLADGGVVRAVLDMCQLLASRGHEMTVLTCDDTDIPPEWRRSEEGVPKVTVLDRPARPLGLFSEAQLADIQPFIEHCDVLHLHACWTTANNQFARIARSLRKPYVLSVHGMLDDWSMAQKSLKKKLYLALGGRKTLEEAALVHCTAASELEQSKKWYPRGEGMVVPLIFDLEPYRTLPGPQLADATFGPAGSGDIDPAAPVILFLSRVHMKKGPDVLVRAAAAMKRRGVRARFLIAGPSEQPYDGQIRSLIRELAVEDDVRLVGLVTGQKKASLFERADVFALPTSQENFGFVFPESLACRTPVVTTRGVDIWPELASSGGALIVDRTPDAFADAIASLLADAAQREEMGRCGRAWVFEYLEPEAIARKFETMYARALEKMG